MHQSTLWSIGDRGDPICAPIDAALEICAYEALWSEHNASFKTIAERFRGAPGARPAAHRAAIKAGGRTIAVIGTPLGQVYPKANAGLQEEIARDHLLVSQVPVLRYDAQDFRSNRFFFPERNKLMSALTQATIIVEAGETSGTLVQAREALRQGRKLFIMNSCFERDDLTWPRRFEQQGAIRIHSYADVRRELVAADPQDR